MLERIRSRALNPDVGDVCGVGGNAPAAAADSPGVGKFDSPGVGKLVCCNFLPESLLPESVQNGSPTVIVGPKLLALPSLKHLIGYLRPGPPVDSTQECLWKVGPPHQP